MRVIGFVCLALFLCSACNGRIEEHSERENSEDNLKTTPEKVVVSVEEQLKNGLWAIFYERKVLSFKDNTLFFSFKFDLNSDGGIVPDTYGSYLKFKFEVEDEVTFPEEVSFKEKEFSEAEEMPMMEFEGKFKKVAVSDEFIIYSSLKPVRTLVLLKNNERTGNCAYYFIDDRAKNINGENVYNVIEESYSGGEMTIEHSRSSILANHED